MNKKVVIIDDNPTHSENIKIGVHAYDKNIKVVETYKSIEDIIENIKDEDISSLLKKKFNLYIIDVALSKGKDEFGLDLYKQLKNKLTNNFKYIVVSEWDINDFQTPVDINSDYFINKNLFSGYEIQFPIERLTKRRLEQ